MNTSSLTDSISKCLKKVSTSQNKFLYLDNPEKKGHRRQRKTRGTDGIGSLEKSPKLKIKADFALSLEQLWTPYANDLVANAGSDVECQILKMDLHGARISVSKSKNAQLVHLNGIIVKETLKSFFVFDSQTSKTRCVPKKDTIFEMPIGSLKIYLFGNQLIASAASRSSKKIKSKPTIAL